MKIIPFILNNKELSGAVLAALWEIVVRIKPTWKDWSLVNNLKRIIDVIPNKKPDGNLH